MKKILITILALVSIMSFSSYSVSADEPGQYADRWEPAITDYISGAYYSFDLVNNTSQDYVQNDSSYAQSGANSESGYCDEEVGCRYDNGVSGSGIAHSFIDYSNIAYTTWQESWPN